jgi:hypothetical protein
MPAGPARPLLLAAATLAAAVGAQAALASRPRTELNDVLYLPNPAVARHLDLGLGEAWADWLHLRALLYVVAEFDLDEAAKAEARAAIERGERPPERPPRYVWLAQLYDAITELDPQFLDAYLHGARFLALFDRGDASNPGAHRAVTLLTKATAPDRLGDRWEIWNELGMVHYLDLQDTEAALRALRRATALPGCPLLVAGFVARLSEGTEHDIEVYEHLSQRLTDARAAGDAFMVRALEVRRAEHLARTVWALLQRAADVHRAATGASAPSLEVLQAAVAAQRGWPAAVFTEAGGFWFDASTNTVESLHLASTEEARRRRNLEVEAARYRERHGRLPSSLPEITRDPQSELRAVHHHPRQGWRWQYDPSTGVVSSVPAR